MTASEPTIAESLAWWRTNRQVRDLDTLTALLDRLRAWKSHSDAGRAAQPVPFLKMAWDLVFADEDHDVCAAIGEIEAALAAAEAGALQGGKDIP